MSVERKINLSLTPEEALSGHTICLDADFEALQAKIKAMADVQDPFVDCWNWRAALAWTVFSEDGHSSHVERLSDEEQEQLGVTEDMLYEAIEVTGGAINRSGHYPITEEIRGMLQASLGGYEWPMLVERPVKCPNCQSRKLKVEDKAPPLVVVENVPASGKVKEPEIKTKRECNNYFDRVVLERKCKNCGEVIKHIQTRALAHRCPKCGCVFVVLDRDQQTPKQTVYCPLCKNDQTE
jgi:Zn finger protein HypA/HybF involved in hydrogenase expression